MKLTTTLNRIRACSPCTSGWKTLLIHLGSDFNPDAEINLLTVLESNGVADMLWTLRATIQDSKRITSQLAIEFAEQVLPIFENRYPDDKRPRDAIQAARDYLDGNISSEELETKRLALAATYATNAAAYAADATNAAAYAADATYATNAAAYATYAAYAAAYATYATNAAAYAAYAADAAFAADYAAYAADARKLARDKQAEIIRMILEN